MARGRARPKAPQPATDPLDQVLQPASHASAPSRTLRNGFVHPSKYRAVTRAAARADRAVRQEQAQAGRLAGMLGSRTARAFAAHLPQDLPPGSRLLGYTPRKVDRVLWQGVQDECVAVAYAAAHIAGLPEEAAYRLLKHIAAISLWWVATLGQPWSLDEVLSPTSVEAFAASRPDAQNAGSQQTVRSNLRQIALALHVPGWRSTASYGARERQQPHSREERDKQYAALPLVAPEDRFDAQIVLDLAYRAGLTPGLVEAATGAWVSALPDGCAIHVPARGDKAGRTVPVLGEAGDRILRAARARGTDVLVRPGRARGGKAIEHVAGRLQAAVPGSPRLVAPRAVARWALDLLDAGMPLPELAALAGWAPTTGTAMELLRFLPPPDADRQLTALREAARRGAA